MCWPRTTRWCQAVALQALTRQRQHFHLHLHRRHAVLYQRLCLHRYRRPLRHQQRHRRHRTLPHNATQYLWLLPHPALTWLLRIMDRALRKRSSSAAHPRQRWASRIPFRSCNLPSWRRRRTTSHSSPCTPTWTAQPEWTTLSATMTRSTIPLPSCALACLLLSRLPCCRDTRACRSTSFHHHELLLPHLAPVLHLDCDSPMPYCLCAGVWRCEAIQEARAFCGTSSPRPNTPSAHW